MKDDIKIRKGQRSKPTMPHKNKKRESRRKPPKPTKGSVNEDIIA